ncbi:hypothetical protein A6R68_16578 [Neotoma lepida]|uniref:Uncharacterized protein n=1 Tax=Neotoma lepida TaxID=56216 RepID=A0A1A6HFD9_NEOLE|nr:hypothetical protein A6R68_16578 [Neotoma lepida]
MADKQHKGIMGYIIRIPKEQMYCFPGLATWRMLSATSQYKPSTSRSRCFGAISTPALVLFTVENLGLVSSQPP